MHHRVRKKELRRIAGTCGEYAQDSSSEAARQAGDPGHPGSPARAPRRVLIVRQYHLGVGAEDRRYFDVFDQRLPRTLPKRWRRDAVSSGQ